MIYSEESLLRACIANGGSQGRAGNIKAALHQLRPLICRANPLFQLRVRKARGPTTNGNNGVNPGRSAQKIKELPAN
jgi:hypothetical protein